METVETVEVAGSDLGGSLEGSVIGFLLSSSFSFASTAVEVEVEAEAATEAAEVEATTTEVEADDVDVDVDGCEAGTEIGTFTEVGAFTDIGMLAGAGAGAGTGAGAGAGTETGATPGSGIGMPVDPATEAGSNLVFICAVLLVIHNPLPIKLHWIWSLLFQFYILQNHI